MELIVISDRKLKIMLTEPDMAKYELQPNTADYGDLHTRAALRHIFEDAQAEIGFETQGERLFVQLYTSRNGGCEIFVTKLEECGMDFSSYSEDEKNGREHRDGFASLPNLPEQNSAYGERALLDRIYREGEEDLRYTEERTRVFGFSKLSELLAVTRRLSGTGFSGKSRLYIVQGTLEVWYLILNLSEYGFERLPRRFSFLTEYAEEVRWEAMELYLSEYGRLICGDGAVEILAAL